MTKHLIALVVLGGFAAALAGCKASAEVGDPDPHGGTVSKKETTTVRDAAGNTHTEVKTSTP